MRRALLSVLFALGQTGVSVLHAQHVESIEVRITNVDVVVTDRAGNPVTGLTKEDFQLFENGKLQTITNFYTIEREVERPAVVAAAAPAVETPAPTQAAPEEMRRRRIVFFIDNESLEPFQRNKFITTLEAEIARLMQPGDEATLVLWNRRIIAAQPFTSDVAALQKSLREQMKMGNGTALTDRALVRWQVQSMADDARTHPRERARLYAQARSIVSSWADGMMARHSRLITGLSTTLSRLAGIEGKKVMVFATGAMPMRVGTDMLLWTDQLFGMLGQQITTNPHREAGQRSLFAEIEGLAKQASSDGVTMYMVDASGTSTGVASAESDGGSLHDGRDAAFERMSSTAASLQTVASITGGAAIIGTENFTHVIDTIARDLDSYYSLGYRSTIDDARRRNVEVKVRVPGLRVRSRRSWAPKSATQQMSDRVVANVFHQGVQSELPIAVALRGQPKKKSRNSYNVPLRVTIPSTLTLLPDGDHLAGGFSVYIVVGSTHGDLSNVTRQEYPINIRAADEKSVRAHPITYDLDLLVRGGEQTLSIAIVDQVTNQAGVARLTVHAR